MLWTVVVPLNDLRRAKSRLVDATSSTDQHRALVQAMRADALAACAAATRVRRIVLVTDDASAAADLAGALPRSSAGAGTDVHVVADPPETGLNAAIRAGEQFSSRWPKDGVAVVVSDLPCLTGAALDDVLAAAGTQPRAVVLDRHGTGTTLLTARPGSELDPEFGVGSARRHVDSGAAAVPATAAVRTDVDTAEDLAVARTVGVGTATATVLATETDADADAADDAMDEAIEMS